MSAINLLSSISMGLRMLFRAERFLMRGLSPPWTQKTLSPTTAAMGRKLKVSEMVFQALKLNLLLHSSKNP